ncbi:dipeptide ABC transporter, permease protein DppB [Escherichia coli cloneA_i1]|nr:dipeptide ABC transporter, permease protein DppB [Escherichia coli cloneA_i1]
MRVVDIMLALPSLLLALVLVAIFGPSIGNAALALTFVALPHYVRLFSWPGLGRWLIDALQRRDYPVVQGGVLLVATMIILVNLLVDLLYGVVNPRIRHKK